MNIILVTEAGTVNIDGTCQGEKLTVGVSKIMKRDYAGRVIVHPTGYGATLVTHVVELSDVKQDQYDSLQAFYAANRAKTIQVTQDGADDLPYDAVFASEGMTGVLNSVQRDLVLDVDVNFYDVILTLEEAL